MESADIRSLMREYQRDQAMKEAALYVLGSSNRDLDVQQKRLSILEQKQRLGMPISDDDYEEATNEGKSFYSRVAPSAGKYGLQAIPNPKFMEPHKAGKFFKVAHGVQGELPSMLHGIPLGAAKHGKPSILGKFFSLF